MSGLRFPSPQHPEPHLSCVGMPPLRPQLPGGAWSSPPWAAPPHEANQLPDHAAGSTTRCLALSGTSYFTFLSLSHSICKRGFEFCPPGFYWDLKGSCQQVPHTLLCLALQTPDSFCTPSWHACLALAARILGLGAVWLRPTGRQDGNGGLRSLEGCCLHD